MKFEIFGANDLLKLAQSLLQKEREGQYGVKVYLNRICKLKDHKENKITEDELLELLDNFSN